MKLLSLRGFLCVFIVVACLAYAWKKSAESPLQAWDGPQNIEEILDDPLFKIGDDASSKEVASAAYELCVKLDALNFQILRAEAPNNRPQRVQLDPHKEGKEKENTEKFYKKFKSVFVPRLAQIVADDEITDLLDETSENALRVYLPYLTRAGNIDEIGEIHERELLRYKKALRSDNQDFIKQAFNRLTRVDRYYLNVKEFVWDGFRLVNAATRRQFSDLEYNTIIEFGNKIAEELKSDPYLILNADYCWLILIHNGYEDEAADLRKEFTAAIDPEIAVRAVRDQGIVLNVQLTDVNIYHDDVFDESIFDIPEDASLTDYQIHETRIDAAVSLFLSKPTSQRKRNEILEKAGIARNQISLQRTVFSMTKGNGFSVQNFDLLKTSRLTANSARFLQKKIDEETKKPFNEMNVPFIDLARSALLAFALEEAVLSEDETQIAEACDKFVLRADKSESTAERLVLEAESYAKTNPGVAVALVDRAFEQAKANSGALANYAIRLSGAKKDLEDVK